MNVYQLRKVSFSEDESPPIITTTSATVDRIVDMSNQLKSKGMQCDPSVIYTIAVARGLKWIEENLTKIDWKTLLT